MTYGNLSLLTLLVTLNQELVPPGGTLERTRADAHAAVAKNAAQITYSDRAPAALPLRCSDICAVHRPHTVSIIVILNCDALARGWVLRILDVVETSGDQIITLDTMAGCNTPSDA